MPVPLLCVENDVACVANLFININQQLSAVLTVIYITAHVLDLAVIPVFHIQSGSSPDWFCPICSRDIFPFFDSCSEWSDNVLCVCAACCKARNNSKSVFNPYEVDSDHNSNIFDDSMCNALTTADTILNNCKYCITNDLQDYDSTYTTLYFHNIDGFKSNFHESLINIKSINYTPSIISFCETNLKSDDPEDYSISSYNSEHLFAIPDKNKGSGISLYYKKRIYLTEYLPSTYVITILNVWGVALKLKTLTYT